MTFLIGDIDEMIYMVQLENFMSRDSKKIICKLKKSINGFKKPSGQCYHKFHWVIISSDFEMNEIDDCVYQKFKRSLQWYRLILWNQTISIKELWNKRFWWHLFCIKLYTHTHIHWDRYRGILRLSQKIILIRFLRDLGCRIVNKVISLLLGETSSNSINAIRMTLKRIKCKNFLCLNSWVWNTRQIFK